MDCRTAEIAMVVLLAMVFRDVAALQTRGLDSDTQALLSLKQMVEKDPLHLLDGWGAAGATNSCEWKGVSCSEGRVTTLDLSHGGLVAPLPSSALAAIDQLKVLNLSGNAFYGPGINQLIAFSCSALAALDLSSNNLSGSLMAPSSQPCTTLAHLNLSRNSFRGSLINLTIVSSTSAISVLDLSFNNISGTIPSAMFSDCGSLSWLDLSHNSIEGAIPEGISLCSTLTHLDLSHNLLTSTIPPDIIVPSSTVLINTSMNHLNLSFNELSGHLPDAFQSPVLTELDLSTNGFEGPIPPSLSASPSLQILNLSSNGLSGPIPSSMSKLINLRGLYLFKNNLTGAIPAELGSALAVLEELDLSENQFSGQIPASFTNLSALRYVNLAMNNLTGGFPSNLVCSMAALQTLDLGFNFITGNLPSGALTACRLLTTLDLSANSITGSLPSDICTPQLKELFLQDNELIGTVPEALGNCTSLTVLDLSCNLLSGPLPSSLWRLPLLRSVMIWGNFLHGPLPPSVGMAPNLRDLVLNINLFTGSIPPTLANSTKLEWICLSSNLLTGSIPPSLGDLPMLGMLQIANNSLTGSIPPSLGNSTKLIWLDLNNNLLEGSIPPELSKNSGKITKGTLDHGNEYSFVKYLGRNCIGMGGLIEFKGIREETLFRLLRSIGACPVTRLYRGTDPYYFSDDRGSLEYLDLSYNRLSGTIPSDLSSMGHLLVLSLSHNAITGTIPDSLSNLQNLNILFLDHNMLHGPIPPSLASMGLVNQLDLSYNNLSGPIPETGTMATMPPSVFANNPGLCGTPLPPCTYAPEAGSSGNSSKQGKKQPRFSTLIMAITACGIAIVIAGMSFMAASVMFRQNKIRQHIRDTYLESLPLGSDSKSWSIEGVNEPLSINVATFEKPLRRLTFAHLLEATNGFSPESMIGQGGFGEVYKATLEGGVVVAIKKLIHTVSQGEREFVAEMETLGKIKHRNLVPLCGYCKVGRERLLIYEYMEGGSLDRMLHEEPCCDSSEGDYFNEHCRLSWDIRKRIAYGTARGLCFLHHSCIPHIIHRDLKSSNVLLDDALEARVSDFGMARLLSAAETHLSVSAIVGTPGYVPPEYCHSFRCTTKGDVYSFGVVLMELITGRRPTWTASLKQTSKTHRSTVSEALFASSSDSERDSMSTATGKTGTLSAPGDLTRKELERDNEAETVELVGWVKRQLLAGKEDEILDKRVFASPKDAIFLPNIKSMKKEMLRYLDIAIWCVDQTPHKRPTMLKVIALLRELNQEHGLNSS
ncbi:hypothetical protein KP509_21G054300 [Ceratopteris richardii]|uniref:non-specific serine/threonine protein kinase n=1 Tax=Ceratopteris richardii TaxID=49495 RepID=A0A8T2SDF2_CERRI|nr:hypothetical protein KP509_21G054300 [Ceratopteris richardii]